MNINVVNGHNPNTDWYNFKKWGNTYLELSYDYNEYELIMTTSLNGGGVEKNVGKIQLEIIYIFIKIVQ